MKVALIFNHEQLGTTGVYFERALHELGIPSDHWRLQEMDRIPPGYELYLRVDHGDDYEVKLPGRLRPSAFYAIDTHLARSWRKIRRTAGWYDLVFCCHRDAAEALAGAEWLPLACDVGLHGPRGEATMWDVAFIGTNGGVPRKFYLQALRERYACAYIGQANYRQLSSIYSQARIGFNYSIASDVNMRMFEVMCAGALLVTNALRGDDLTRLGFEERRHLVCYRSPTELFSLIEYYLAHAEERQTIAQAGAEWVRSRHTYAHRMKQLLSTVSARLGVSFTIGEPAAHVANQ